MKNLLIGLGIGLGAAAIYVAKKINDDRQEIVVKSEDGIDLINIETFKQAAKRKVNEILSWIAENSEKVESIVSAISLVSTVVGVCVTIVELYSATRRIFKNPEDELLKEVSEIRGYLVYLSPDVEVESF